MKWPLGNVQAQKFYTDDVSLPWLGYHFWLVMLQGKFAATNKKGSDMSSVYISAVVPQTSFCWETIGGVMKCELFFQASTESTRRQLPISVYLFSQDSLLYSVIIMKGLVEKVLKWVLGRFPFNPKFRKFWLIHQNNGTAHFGLVRLEYSVHFDQSSYLGWSDWNVPFHLPKFLPLVLLFCILPTRTMTQGTVAWVSSVQLQCMYRSIGHM